MVIIIFVFEKTIFNLKKELHKIVGTNDFGHLMYNITNKNKVHNSDHGQRLEILLKKYPNKRTMDFLLVFWFIYR